MTTEAATSPPFVEMRLRRCATVAMYGCAASFVFSVLENILRPESSWACVLFIVLAAAAALLNLARTLPAQNVIASAGLIALMSGIVELINVKSHIPFGVRTYTDAIGPQILGVPLIVPAIWTAAILISRGVARLMLRPWRKTSKYGLWFIGLTCALTVIFDLNVEPFAAANSWWIWQMPRSVPGWQTAPWTNFLAWGVVILLILAFTTPWFINKQRPRSAPPDYHPLFLWMFLNLLAAAGDAAHRLWLPAALAIVFTATVTASAIRNAKW